jgi:hypothetical protein
MKNLVAGSVSASAISAFRLAIAAAGVLLSSAPCLWAKPQVVIVAVDGIRLDDYLRAPGPALNRILTEGAIGLMTPRAAGPLNLTSACATIGAGARARSERAEALGGLVLEHGELYEGVQAQSLARSRLGITIEPGSAAYLGLPLLRLDNQKELSAEGVGLLGESLERQGLLPASLGNADIPEELRRYSSIIAMDAEGKVGAASVGADLYALDPEWPPLFRTNFARLADEFDRLAAKADFIVVDLGDTGRLAAIGQQLEPDILAGARQRALLSADRFLGHLLRSDRGVRRTLILLTPTPPLDADLRPLSLTPVVAWGRGFSPGLLKSPSTRSPGLVVNTDIAPTVLRLLRAQVPKEMVGRPIKSVPRAENEKFAFICWLESDQAALDAVRQPVQHTLAWGFTVLLLIGAAAVQVMPGARARSAVRAASVVWLAAAIGTVLGGLWAAESPASAVLSACLFAVVLVAGAFCTGRPTQTLCGLAVAAMLLDAVSGQRLVRQSLLGYSASAGSRFYGLGNESAGLLLAMALMSWLLWVEAARDSPRRRLAASAMLAVVCLVILLPAFGADLGMGAAAVVGVMALRGRIRGKPAAWAAAVAGAVILTVAVALAFDIALGSHGLSHIGRTLAGGGEGLPRLLARKAAMNLLLLHHSPWAFTALAGLAALLLVRPRLQSQNAHAAIRGLLAGAGAALVLNDSGIVAAGIILAAGTCAILAEWAKPEEKTSQSC